MTKKGKTNVKVEIQQKILQQKFEEETKTREIEEMKAIDKKYKEEVKKEVVVDKATLNQSYPEVTYQTNQNVVEDTNSLNLVIIGHVDSGKSTLTGHLLYKLGEISDKQLRKNEKKTEEYGKTGFQFAYCMDETEEEQQRGVTIEVTTKFFNTKKRSFCVMDAPGHRDFIANMITGTAQANCAILVIDSLPGAFERGWQGF